VGSESCCGSGSKGSWYSVNEADSARRRPVRPPIDLSQVAHDGAFTPWGVRYSTLQRPEAAVPLGLGESSREYRMPNYRTVVTD
jgi:hypothetical protein